jgi:hypothetical protein
MNESEEASVGDDLQVNILTKMNDYDMEMN